MALKIQPLNYRKLLSDYHAFFSFYLNHSLQALFVGINDKDLKWIASDLVWHCCFMFCFYNLFVSYAFLSVLVNMEK